MTDTTLWLIVLTIGLITFSLRFSFILLFGRIDLPQMLTQALRFVPVAVLTALVLPALVYGPNRQFDISLGNERLLAGIAAGVMAWYSKNVVLTISVGMVTLWLLQ